MTSGIVGAGLVQHLEGLGEDRAVAQHLEPVQGHEPELRGQVDGRGVAVDREPQRVDDRVGAGVDDRPPRPLAAQVVDLVLGGREVQGGDLRHDAAVELLGHGVPDVARAHAGLDVRHLGAEEASDQGPEDGAEGVAVHDHERAGRAPAQPAGAARRDGVRRYSSDAERPPGHLRHAHHVASGDGTARGRRPAGGARGRRAWPAARRRGRRCSRARPRHRAPRSARITGASLMISAVVPAMKAIVTGSPCWPVRVRGWSRRCSIVCSRIRRATKGWSTTVQDTPPLPTAEARAGVRTVARAARRGHASLQRGHAGSARALDALEVAAARADWPLEVVVVDDGATDAESLRRARRARPPSARAGPAPGQRRTVRGAPAWASRPSRPTWCCCSTRASRSLPSRSSGSAPPSTAATTVWNYDVVPGSRDLRALFWTGITKVWWRDYFRTRRPVAFGLDDFDRYPKGTGAFLAPAQPAAGGGRRVRVALRRRQPGLRRHPPAARRRRGRRHPPLARGDCAPTTPRAGGASWSRQCYYRGTTFVDGYLTDPARARGPAGRRRSASPWLGGLAALALPAHHSGRGRARLRRGRRRCPVVRRARRASRSRSVCSARPSASSSAPGVLRGLRLAASAT